MQQFEKDYAKLIEKIINEGEVRKTRNGETTSIFGAMLTVPMNGDMSFPILQGRKMFPKGVFGELAAILRGPKSLKDFEDFGCNYWKQWAKKDGSINVDYGNAWHADGQIEKLKTALKYNNTDRRMIISGWRPDRLDDLDLPCCHLLYQFYVREGKYLDMIWYQRSVDTMIGLPSDIIFAATWLIAIANEFAYTPGEIKMSLGDCHIYAEHYLAAKVYANTVKRSMLQQPPTYRWIAPIGMDFCLFAPTAIIIENYTHHNKMDLELKA